jgi:hypothetical protein
MNTRSPGKPDTGPPTKNVEPAWQQPSGQIRRRRRTLTASNNPLPRCSRQVRGIVALTYTLPAAAWNRLRKNSYQQGGATMATLMSSLFLTGRLVGDPVFSETAKGKGMAKLLLETELVREVNRGEFRAETHRLPILLFSWVADQARTLRAEARLRLQLVSTVPNSPRPRERYGMAFN